MLGKLIKHEFKATWRSFVPMYVAVTLLTGLISLAMCTLDDIDNSFLVIASGFSVLFGILALIFVFASPYIFLSVRFYRTTATREAYLTFTVPADTKLIVLSKFIVAFIWNVLCFAFGFLALATILYAADGNNVFEVFEMLFINGSFTDNLMQILTFVMGLISSLLAIFAAIALGQIVRDHRVIASIAFYAAIYTVQQIISVVVILPYYHSIITSSVDVTTVEDTIAGDFPMLLISLITATIFSVVEYFITCYFLNKKLNLL